MAAPVWVLSVDLQAKTATFQSGMAEAAKSARGSFTEIKSGSSEMGGHVNTNMFAARHSVMALSEAFGGQLPRAITAFISHIGPLGALLEAAFPFAAIGLAAVLLTEHLAKLKEEGIKLTEDQLRFGTAVQNAYNALDQRLVQAGIKADELNNDHLGALHLQLQLIDRQSMDELVHSFGIVGKAADVVFADLKKSWYQFDAGSAGAKQSLDSFAVAYEDFLARGDEKGASDLLAQKIAREEHFLNLMSKAKDANGKRGESSDEGFTAQLQYHAAVNELSAAGVKYDESTLASHVALVSALYDQLHLQGQVAAIKKAEGGNATATTGHERSAREAEAAKQAAEHAQKMGELSLSIEREQANESNGINEASINERLMSDMRLAGEEYAILEQANTAKIAALDRSGKDYNNQLKDLQDKEEEITLQHAATVGALLSKAREATNREAIQDLEQSEREQIEGTEQGSRERLQAIDAALKEERNKGLASTTFYRDLMKERIQVQRQADDEAAKSAAEAGKESAANEQKMGELSLAAEQQKQALLDSARRVTIQQRLTEEIAAANAEFALKDAAMKQEVAALDRSGKDYENKLKAIQDKETQLVQEHENQITAIKDKAMMDRNNRILSAESHFNDTIAAGLTQVLMGHKTFASMMNSLGDQVVSGMTQNAIKSILTNDMTKESDAAKAARSAYLTGQSIGGPAGFILGPVMAAAAFTSVMAFSGGTDGVPGMGHGDTVPAMLTPGEGVVPGGVMDGLRKMASSGTMGGGTHYHVTVHSRPNVQALDGDGMAKVLDNHTDAIAKHVSNELRKLNR